MANTLSEILSPEGIAKMDEKFHADNAAHAARVADTTAKRKANNAALFGKPE